MSKNPSPISASWSRLRSAAEALSPFNPAPERNRLIRQALPFIGLAAIADASAALPSGPRYLLPFVVGTILLGVVCFSNALPWRGYPRWMAVFPPCLYVVSVTLIIVSVGTVATGMVPIFLVPVLWSALYQQKWQSAVVVTASIAAILGLSLTEHAQLVTMVRRTAFWGAAIIVLTLATHALRDRLERAVAQSEESIRQADGLSQAAQHLTSILEPDAVLMETCLLAAVMVSPPGTPRRRAKYFRIDGDTAVGAWGFDDNDDRSSSTYLLAEHPYMAEVVRTGSPVCAAYDLEAVGPTLRSNVLSTGTTHGAWIPISPNGVLHGVLTVSSSGKAISDELFARVISLGHIAEMALSNALALQASRREAATDPLTGVANRRGFELTVAEVRGRRPFSVLAIDVDDLKAVNDAHGHSTGDAVLVGIAQATTRVMRQGDFIARTGGDEFAAFLGDTSEDGAETAARRILEVLSEARIDGVVPAVSVGIACGTPDAELMTVLRDADNAMYVAKRRGGSGYALAESAFAAQAVG